LLFPKPIRAEVGRDPIKITLNVLDRLAVPPTPIKPLKHFLGQVAGLLAVAQEPAAEAVDPRKISLIDSGKIQAFAAGILGFDPHGAVFFIDRDEQNRPL
jgi:hypothetical protein